MKTGNDTETTLFGIRCDCKHRQASITQQNARKIFCLVHETRLKRDERAGIEHNNLRRIEELQGNGTLSDENQKICEIWDNLNFALKEMEATFCNEFEREVSRFSESAEKSCYNLLVALREFDALYPTEQ